jgi:DNA invertase Pin-like site-specific DNA recombinase
VDDSTRKALVAEEERQLKLARARAEKARAAKAAKAARVTRDIPVEVAPAPAPEPASIIKSTWDAKTALEGISVLQARELYTELKNIFGN